MFKLNNKIAFYNFQDGLQHFSVEMYSNINRAESNTVFIFNTRLNFVSLDESCFTLF